MHGGDRESVSTAALWTHKHTAFTSARYGMMNAQYNPQFKEIIQMSLYLETTTLRGKSYTSHDTIKTHYCSSVTNAETTSRLKKA